MLKYLFSRVCIVFLFKFFGNWVFNIRFHLAVFFDLTDGFFMSTLVFILGLIILALGIFVLNLVLSIVNLTDEMSVNELIEEIKGRGLLGSLSCFISNFNLFLGGNFSCEIKSEKPQQIFLFVAIFFLLFIKGNFIVNNYYGIYKQYTNSESYSERRLFVVGKTSGFELSKLMREIEESADEDELYFEVRKRGYLCKDAAVIDGFKDTRKTYFGFGDYLVCLLLSALEKFICVLFYFAVPLVVFILIYKYNFERRS